MTQKEFIEVLRGKGYEYELIAGRVVVGGGSVYLSSLTSLPEGVQFNNSGLVDLRSLKEHDAVGCGNEHRNIKIVHGSKYGYRVSLGCFIGTEEEAVAAIRAKYGEGSDYEAKVVAAFAKYK